MGNPCLGARLRIYSVRLFANSFFCVRPRINFFVYDFQFFCVRTQKNRFWLAGQPPDRPEAGPISGPELREMLIKPMENKHSDPFLSPPTQDNQQAALEEPTSRRGLFLCSNTKKLILGNDVKLIPDPAAWGIHASGPA